MQGYGQTFGGQPSGLVLAIYLHPFARDFKKEHALVHIPALLLLLKLPVLFAQVNHANADSHVGAAIDRRNIVCRFSFCFQAHTVISNSLFSTTSRMVCVSVSGKSVNALGAVYEQRHMHAIIPAERPDDIDTNLDFLAVRNAAIRAAVQHHVAAIFQAAVDLFAEQPEGSACKVAVDLVGDGVHFVSGEFLAQIQHAIQVIQFRCQAALLGVKFFNARFCALYGSLFGRSRPAVPTAYFPRP